MHNLSMTQALSIWSDLEAAYYGQGRLGDTAVIYMYRLMPCSPASEQAPDGADARERIRIANVSLYHLLDHFEEEREVKLWVKRLSTDLKGNGYAHSVEVRVEHRQRGTDTAKD